MQTTQNIKLVKISNWKPQSTIKTSTLIQVFKVIYLKLPLKAVSQHIKYAKIVVKIKKVVVSNVAPFFPIKYPKQPAQKKLSKGKNILSKYIKVY